MKSRISLFLFVFLLIPLYSESIGLGELLDRTAGRCLWDPVMKKGMIIKGSRSVTFSTEYPLLILGSSEVVAAGSIVYSNNRVAFSEDAASLISDYLMKKESSGPGSRYRVAGILIDPGHGGRDSGAVSQFPVDGISIPLKEKHLVLELSLRLQELLKKRFPDKEILMTRKDDVYPTLETRVKQANDFDLEAGEGIIFISIHANASLNAKAKGIEVWYLPENYRRNVLDDANSANRELAPILNTLLEEEFTLESRKLAESTLDSIMNNLSSETENRGLKEESWFVVRNAMMASILIETGFISNEEECDLLRDPSYLQNMTEGIYNGIVEFVDFFEY